ncbi:MAG: DUF167 domain-containing protein [Acidimicrobiaceae bacterium]|nr:DUF167 domain-containing protein [Acidimicrobiaceae bacterium]
MHVHPNSKTTGVGGTHGASLVIRVRSRAIDGAATAEMLKLAAQAFDVAPSAVSLVRGSRSREKLVDIEGPSANLYDRLNELLAQTKVRP